MTKTSGAFATYFNGFDIITPIHSPKFKQNGSIESILPVGSCSLGDSRNFGSEAVPLPASGIGIVVPGSTAGLVSANGVPGNTTGSAIASGYIGEIIASTLTTTSVSVVSSNLTSTVLRRITALTAGTYLIQCFITPGVPTGAFGRLRIYSTASGGGATVYGLVNDLWMTTSGVTGTNATFGVWFAAAGATLDLLVDTLSGSLTGGPYTVTSSFTAVRIA
jgi:hypothetical protein